MKQISTLLAVVLLAASLPFQAFADYNSKTMESAAKKMNEIGLVKGDQTGDLRLASSITRAELVTIIVRAFGYEELATELKGAKAFPDSAKHGWASGYIAAAKYLMEQRSPGEAVGKPDGSFDPDGKVTYAESLAFLMKFLGIKRDPDLAWPVNYIRAAVDAGLISQTDADLIEENKNAPATRGLVFYFQDQAFSRYELEEDKTVYNLYEEKMKEESAESSAPKEEPKEEQKEEPKAEASKLQAPTLENIHIVYPQPPATSPNVNVLFPDKAITRVVVYDKPEGGKILGESNKITIFEGNGETIPYFGTTIAGGFPKGLTHVYVVVYDAQGNAAPAVAKPIQ